MRVAGIAVAVVVLGFLPAAAWAGGAVPSCIAPPGTAAIDEYCEQVLPPNLGKRRPKDLPAISRKTFSELVSAPQARRLVLAVGRLRVGRRRLAPEARAWPTPAYPGTVPGITSAVGQGSILGDWTIVALLAVLLAMSSWAILRHRAAPPADGA